MTQTHEFGREYSENLHKINTLMRVGESFDILIKRMKIGGRRATMYAIDGFVKDEMLEKEMEYLSKLTEKDLANVSGADDFLDAYITYIESSTVSDTEQFITFIFSGAVGMIVEGFDKAIIIDCRTYPARNVEEPESDKVLRGSHEGFVETILFNTALIRRKIRNPNLTMKSFQIGRESKTDVVICYLEDCVNRKQLDAVTKRLKEIDVKSLTMSQESLKECLIPGQAWNPLPKVRYTERPDAAAACIFDGNIVILTDGSPSAMIIPTGIFDFAQNINDFYFSPCVGTLLRVIRSVVFGLSMLFIPVWYLLVYYGERLPSGLGFLLIEEPNSVPIIFQLLVVEFVIDTLRLASLNTPSALSGSFSVVGALVLGEFAVRSGWFVSEVVLFMAFVAISNFTQPSYELGYAIKIFRTLILILCGFFKIWGLIAGILLFLITVACTKTLTGYTYLYPLFPFDKEALKSLLYRRPLKCKYQNDAA
ncbi:MAG: spore germination protein [Oscillospiraceae bacterium]|nr:spore germination protein [Oscillospiraceae bacterium]